MTLPRFIFALLSLTIHLSLITSDALAQETEERNVVERLIDRLGEDVPAKFISDGLPISINRLGIKITPPKDWEVITDSPRMSLVMQEQEPKKVVYNKPIYRRNITLAAVHKPTPIDATRAASLKRQLQSTFGKDGSIENFQIVEHKFFDYKSKNDGLLVYSAFNMGEFNMMQMHVLVSSANKQFMLTYTDLAERFSQQELFEQGWRSIVSIEVTGQAPWRYEPVVKYGVPAGLILILLIILLSMRNRSAKKTYLEEADVIYRDDEFAADGGPQLPVTQTGYWKLDTAGNLDFEDQYDAKTQPGLSFISSSY